MNSYRPRSVPAAASLRTAVVVRRRSPGSIRVARVAGAVPVAGSRPRTEDLDLENEGNPGAVTISDRVVTKIASRAAAENPDAGGVAARIMGNAIPGLDKIGGRATSLGALPKATGDVDGARAFLHLELSVRYPAPIVEVTEDVRRRIVERVRTLTGVEALEVDIAVRALLTNLPPPPRVR